VYLTRFCRQKVCELELHIFVALFFHTKLPKEIGGTVAFGFYDGRRAAGTQIIIQLWVVSKKKNVMYQYGLNFQLSKEQWANTLSENVLWILSSWRD
jgi:hypothetical protein